MKNIFYLLVFTFSIVSTGCGKEFLEVKADKSDVIPSTITDLQALLDDATGTINIRSCNELGLIGSDEYYLTDQTWATLPSSATPYEKNGYYWSENNVYEGQQVRDWDYAYRRILFANTALEGIDKIHPTTTEQSAWGNVKGSALFIRAITFYQLAQEFCRPYQVNSATANPGIPLRLKPDITAKVNRGTLAQTYEQIIRDLVTAVDLLPVEPLIKYRPSRPAVFALLAKTYLQMGNYTEAKKYAGLSLSLKKTLIDFNILNVNAAYCFPANMQNNPEILYVSFITNIPTFTVSRAKIDPELYNSYDENDLGKKVYFAKNTDGTYSFKGSYYGAAVPLFTGLAIDEVVLIEAESAARTGDLKTATDDLNYLLKNRYDINKFSNLVFSNAEEVLDVIIAQRRKRLLFRGIRWEDLRRLNLETRFQKIIRRTLNGAIHELKPGDTRYTWPLPDAAIELGGYQQNER